MAATPPDAPAGAEVDPPLRLYVHPRARRLRLTINHQGARLSLPPGVAEFEVRAFLARNRDWLRRHWAALAPAAAQDELKLDGNDAVLLRGVEHRLVGEAGAPPRVIAADGLLSVDGHRGCARRASALLLQWLAAQLDRDLQVLLGRYAPALGWPRRVRIRALRSLWGSLAADGSMSVDLALVGAPPAVLEYLVVHELAHLSERNHGPRFWALVERELPGWREQRRWLREHGQTLKAGLSRLRV